jgi:glucosamine-6-phosphate deaminase
MINEGEVYSMFNKNNEQAILERIITVDHLMVEVYQTRKAMGEAAGVVVVERIKKLLAVQKTVRMIFAAAPSQNEFLATLSTAEGIDWSRVVALHLDDYLGLPDGAPQRFSSYLKEHLFNLVHPGQIHYLVRPNSILTKNTVPDIISKDIAEACENYSRLLKEQPIDIVCMGIGENGHVAFNDPPVADFNDPQLVKLVELEDRCRKQQVNDGCFTRLAEVPTHALTLTVPALMMAREIYCMVPGPTKRDAVKRTLEGTISTECPATILRRQEHAKLYLDLDSAAGLGL